MKTRKLFALVLCAWGAWAGSAASSSAQDVAQPSVEDRVAALEKKVGVGDSDKVTEAANAGHNAWMLTSSALVLMMTGPALALFYCGLVRKKNVLSVMMQCVFLMCLLSVVWALWGYSIAFGGFEAKETDPAEVKKAAEEAGYSPYWGTFQYLFMKNVEHTGGKEKVAGSAPTEGSIPRLTHMLFQGMFFVITPALICGAFAERMKFSAMVLFMILWGTVVYCPIAHWVWDGGILAYGSSHAIWGGALDFAGGTVVHISSGTSALICALVLGKRLGFGSQPMPPHNLTYTAVGAALLWVGWFGFNAGSELGSDAVAASAFAATHFAAAAGGLGWAGMEWITRGKPSILGTCSGIVAGLVCITPASGFVNPMPAIVMGLAAGVVCFLACTLVKSKFGYDDALDAFGVHGIGGTLGALLTGVFATVSIPQPVANADNNLLGLIEGGTLIKGQVAAVAVTWAFSIAMTFVLLKIVDALVGLRVAPQDEVQGLDLSQHGEEGYIFI